VGYGEIPKGLSEKDSPKKTSFHCPVCRERKRSTVGKASLPGSEGAVEKVGPATI